MKMTNQTNQTATAPTTAASEKYAWAKAWLKKNGYTNALWVLLALHLSGRAPARVNSYAKAMSKRYVKGHETMDSPVFDELSGFTIR